MNLNESIQPGDASGASPPVPLEIVREPAELEAFLEDVLSVCSPGPVLVAGVEANQAVRALLNRGIDAYGFETAGSEAPAGMTGIRGLSGRMIRLPFENARFESALLFGALDTLKMDDLTTALAELSRVVKRTVITVSAASAAEKIDEELSGDAREWWDHRFIAGGFRKHPLRSWLVPYETLDHQGAELIMVFERVADCDAEPPMTFDASREAGGLSDALLARYELAAKYIRPWDVVLDLGCESGCGTHLMRRASRGGRFIGIDPSETAIEYARIHFGRQAKNAEFRSAPLLDTLRSFADNSVHFIFCSDECVEPTVPSGDWLGEFERILTPGGRLLLSISEPLKPEGEDARLHSAPEKFLVEEVFQLNMHHDGGLEAGIPSANRVLRPVSARTAPQIQADWRLVLLMKDPVRRQLPPYEETVFGNLNGSNHVSVEYSEQYRNPFILHALMHASFRVTSPQLQTECAWRIFSEEPRDSVDTGAALCLLLYRMMDGQLPVEISETSILERVAGYLAIGSPSLPQLRWQISLSSALGMYHLRRGDFEKAKTAFLSCTKLDPFFNLSLAGRPVEAWFWLGWLAFSDGDLDTAERQWNEGLRFGDRIVRRGLDETLMQPSWPNLFDWGDGMRELTQSLESVTQCANGLHCVRLQRQGISFRWDLIPNTFRAQRDNRERLLRQAQYRVGKLCAEIDDLRAEVRARDSVCLEKELDATFLNMNPDSPKHK